MTQGPPDSAAVASRVAIAAAALGIDAAGLVPHLTDVGDGGLHNPLVWSDADATLLGVASGLPADDAMLPRRMTVLAAGIGDTVALARTVMARAGEVWVERWSDHRAVVALLGAATLEEDVIALAAIGTSADNARATGARIGALAGDGARLRLLRTTIRPRDVETCELGVQAEIDVIGRIAQHAGELGIGDAQLRLLEQVHAILAHGRTVLLRAGVRGAALVPGISITYGAQTLDHALRVVTGLATRDDAASRFGTLTGSLGSERIAAVELQLGPSDPMPARIAIAL